MKLSAEISAIGALADPVRRRLYEYVASQTDAVSRDNAATAANITASNAKFHLEKMVEEGLLVTEFRRTSGKTGPGAGRPAKLYRRSDTPIQVSLPERNYDRMGSILASAIERAGSATSLDEAIAETAYEAGKKAGEQLQGFDQAEDVFEELGYEPVVVDGQIRLRNCPFDTLAKEHTDLVCGVNESYTQGVLDGCNCTRASAHLEPSDGFCCVVLKSATGM